jgi:hypothetical protein
MNENGLIEDMEDSPSLSVEVKKLLDNHKNDYGFDLNEDGEFIYRCK